MSAVVAGVLFGFAIVLISAFLAFKIANRRGIVLYAGARFSGTRVREQVLSRQKEFTEHVRWAPWVGIALLFAGAIALVV